MSEQLAVTSYDDSHPGLRPVPDNALASFMHPNAILNNELLPEDDKRGLLASWASDSRTVTNQPSLRQGDDGTIFHIDDILHALKSLDHSAAQSRSGRQEVVPGDPAWITRSRSVLDRWLNGRSKRHGPDDHDDPPPCPASGRPFGPAPAGGDVCALAAT